MNIHRSRPAMQTWLVLTAALGAACSDGDRLERSCDGEALTTCAAYEYAVVTSARVEPSGITLGDPTLDATFHVELRTCGAKAPDVHEVVVELRRDDDPDAGTRVVTLARLRDDGTGADAAARDGIVDAQLDNPFFDDLPPNATVTLRFLPRTGLSCAGDPLEIDYMTGPRFAP